MPYGVQIRPKNTNRKCAGKARPMSCCLQEAAQDIGTLAHLDRHLPRWSPPGRSRKPPLSVTLSFSSGVSIKTPYLLGTWSWARILGSNPTHRKMCSWYTVMPHPPKREGPQDPTARSNPQLTWIKHIRCIVGKGLPPLTGKAQRVLLCGAFGKRGVQAGGAPGHSVLPIGKPSPH